MIYPDQIYRSFSIKVWSQKSHMTKHYQMKIAFWGALICITPQPVIKVYQWVRQSILHSCSCFTSNEQGIITLRVMVCFPEGEFKTTSKWVGSSNNLWFSSIPSSFYFHVSFALRSPRKLLILLAATNSYLEMPPKLCGFEEDISLRTKIKPSPRHLVSITSNPSFP